MNLITIKKLILFNFVQTKRDHASNGIGKFGSLDILVHRQLWSYVNILCISYYHPGGKLMNNHLILIYLLDILVHIQLWCYVGIQCISYYHSGGKLINNYLVLIYLLDILVHQQLWS